MKQLMCAVLLTLSLVACGGTPAPTYSIQLGYHNSVAGASQPSVNAYVNGALRGAVPIRFLPGSTTDGTGALPVEPNDRVCVQVGASSLAYRYTVSANRSGPGAIGFLLEASGADVVSFKPANDNTGETTPVTTCP